jgi:hypothetical protein
MATKKITDAVLNIRLGAIFRMAIVNALSRENVERLLVSRAGFAAHEAELLACHWFSTSALRRRAA